MNEETNHRRKIAMKWEGGSWRLWLFRGLVAIAAGLMIASFTMVWWNAHVEYSGGYYQRKSESMAMAFVTTLVVERQYIIADETPLYQTILAWIYLVLVPDSSYSAHGSKAGRDRCSSGLSAPDISLMPT